ncbi:MAG: HAD family hydrolase [Mucilaginibacter sp.]
MLKDQDIQVIAFDADDTLWENEPYFREAEALFCDLLKEHLPNHVVSKQILEAQVKNLPLYGYGVKGLVLSMIETLGAITNGQANFAMVEEVMKFGKTILNKPVILLEGVTEVLESLKGHYRLVVATKGDLLDQERKLKKSGLQSYFHHIEIMSDKKATDYRKLLKHLDCKPENFVMIGNSLKSDILPVLELGGNAVHIPFHVTWEHEMVEQIPDHPRFSQLSFISELFTVITI